MPNHPEAITGGELPASTHLFDVTVSFVAPLQTVIWRSGQAHDAVIHVTSRPSLLYQRLFITSLEIAGIIQDVLITIAAIFGVLELIAFIMAVRLNQTIYQLDQRFVCGDAGGRRGELHAPDRSEAARPAGGALYPRSTR